MIGGRHDQRGFALIAAIGVLAVMAMLAAGLSISLRRETNMARNFQDAADAQARADAGLYIAVESLLSRDPHDRLPVDGSVHTVMFEGTPIQVALQDEAGKIDLNFGSVSMIERLAVELGIEPGAQSALAAGVLARRKSSLHSAPATARDGPRLADIAGSPFRTEDEVLTLPGMTRQAYARLRPFLTVYAESAFINPQVAPREILAAIPGLAPGDTETILSVRLSARSELPAAIAERIGPFARSQETRSITVRSEVTMPARAHFIREAVVALTGRPYEPIRFLEWRQEFDDLPVLPEPLGVAAR